VVIGLDIGSSSAKALLVDPRGRVRRAARRRFATARGPGGRVEHDALAVLRATRAALDEAASGAPEHGTALGVATQRSTVVFWDRDSGRPLTPAWSWQDTRAARYCAAIARRHRGAGDAIAARTGLRLSPHYAGPKLALMLRRHPALRRSVRRGRALWGTLGTFLAWHLTGGAVYAIDHANAQRTVLFRLDDLGWDPELFALVGAEDLLEAPALPALVPVLWESGVTTRARGRTLSIAAMTGDQQAALDGLRCRRVGDIAINYGSGAFVLIRTGGRPARVPGLLTTLVVSRHTRGGSAGASARDRRGRGAAGGCDASFAVEGTVNAAATALDWVQRRAGLRVRTAALDGYLDAALGPSSGATPRLLHFLPAISGIGAPRWDPRARARFAGRTRGAGPADLLAAAIESIAQRCAEIVRVAEAGGALPTRGAARTAVRASGGLIRVRRLVQAQADLLQRAVVLAAVPDATALGAARLAARSADPSAARVTPGGADIVVAPRVGRRAAADLARAWTKAVYGFAAGAAR
jgi:glycerol kinase